MLEQSILKCLFLLAGELKELLGDNLLGDAARLCNISELSSSELSLEWSFLAEKVPCLVSNILP